MVSSALLYQSSASSPPSGLQVPVPQYLSSVSSLPQSSATDIAFAIGPEGGFSEKEEQYAESTGFIPARFGPHTLKVETAAICALAVACEKFGV